MGLEVVVMIIKNQQKQQQQQPPQHRSVATNSQRQDPRFAQIKERRGNSLHTVLSPGESDGQLWAEPSYNNEDIRDDEIEAPPNSPFDNSDAFTWDKLSHGEYALLYQDTIAVVGTKEEVLTAIVKNKLSDSDIVVLKRCSLEIDLV